MKVIKPLLMEAKEKKAAKKENTNALVPAGSWGRKGGCYGRQSLSFVTPY